MGITIPGSDDSRRMMEEEAKVIIRDRRGSTAIPMQASEVEFVDEEKFAVEEEVGLPYAGHPNVPNINVANAIKAAFGNTGYHAYLSDSSYTGYTLNELWRYLKYSEHTDLIPYMSQIFDCDDFAQVLQGSINRVFKGIPFGTLWFYHKTEHWGHAINIFYSYQHNKIVCVEPQNDNMFWFNKNAWRAYLVII
ncbi:MAG: hypothetical protein C4B57_09125 [Deltaproteobacteria bacterium]|nr:lectin MOA-related protein [Deltaproteobacteria bacterium]PXF53742.1 MAG: hypothetical protein C4B57_09125 [Deltaproteobacteria bacterium]